MGEEMPSFVKQPKKMLVMNILDILKRYSDADHRLSQKDILEILETEYGMEADRKAIKRNLMNLIEAGYPIEYSESVRINKNGEEDVLYTDWYLEREFSDAELRLLIDSILFSKHIPYSQCKQLIEKIEGLSNRYFRAKVRHICNLPEDQPNNTEIFLTIEVLDEAIERGLQVTFRYADFGTDKQLHPRLNSEGMPREYIINPYQMAATNGKYYLIGNVDHFDNISHFRIDRIRDIKLLDTPVKAKRKVKGLEHGLNLPKHMAEHIYMYSGESAVITMRVNKKVVGDVVDWFGKGVSFSDETEEFVIARVTANLPAMRFWALQYASYVRVLSPQSLVDTVRADLAVATQSYADDTGVEE